MQALDPDKIKLVCSAHSAFTFGCAQCNMVNFVTMIARSKNPREDFERLEALVHAMCELEDDGKLDIQLQRHPTITVEHEDA